LKFVKNFKKYITKFVFKAKKSENAFQILKPGAKKEIRGGGRGVGGRENLSKAGLPAVFVK
jgi:hypothetical protein